MNENVYRAIEAERSAQRVKWGGEIHDDGHSPNDWIEFVMDHARRAWPKRAPPCGCREASCMHFNISPTGDQAEYRKQMVRVAALAIAALESLDRWEKQQKEMSRR